MRAYYDSDIVSPHHRQRAVAEHDKVEGNEVAFKKRWERGHEQLKLREGPLLLNEHVCEEHLEKAIV